jgi:hypothetical protein
MASCIVGRTIPLTIKAKKVTKKNEILTFPCVSKTERQERKEPKKKTDYRDRRRLGWISEEEKNRFEEQRLG